MPIPEPGTKAYEDMVAFMRADLLTDMKYSKLIHKLRGVVSEQFAKQGKDFDKEFKKWKEKGGVNYGTQ